MSEHLPDKNNRINTPPFGLPLDGLRRIIEASERTKRLNFLFYLNNLIAAAWQADSLDSPGHNIYSPLLAFYDEHEGFANAGDNPRKSVVLGLSSVSTDVETNKTVPDYLHVVYIILPLPDDWNRFTKTIPPTSSDALIMDITDNKGVKKVAFKYICAEGVFEYMPSDTSLDLGLLIKYPAELVRARSNFKPELDYIEGLVEAIDGLEPVNHTEIPESSSLPRFTGSYILRNLIDGDGE